jgi:hypothetical protein
MIVNWGGNQWEKAGLIERVTGKVNMIKYIIYV